MRVTTLKCVVLVVACLLAAPAAAQLTLVVDPANKTLAVTGSDSGTGTFEDGESHMAWLVNTGTTDCVLPIPGLIAGSPDALILELLLLGTDYFFLRLAYPLPLDPITLTGTGTTVSYAGLAASCQAYLESLDGAAIPVDAGRGVGFASLNVMVLTPVPASRPVWLLALTVLTVATTLVALHRRRGVQGAL